MSSATKSSGAAIDQGSPHNSPFHELAFATSGRGVFAAGSTPDSPPSKPAGPDTDPATAPPETTPAPGRTQPTPTEPYKNPHEDPDGGDGPCPGGPCTF